jgi:hypothetical protein
MIVGTDGPEADVFVADAHKAEFKRLVADQFDCFDVECGDLLENDGLV